MRARRDLLATHSGLATLITNQRRAHPTNARLCRRRPRTLTSRRSRHSPSRRWRGHPDVQSHCTQTLTPLSCATTSSDCRPSRLFTWAELHSEQRRRSTTVDRPTLRPPWAISNEDHLPWRPTSSDEFTNLTHQKGTTPRVDVKEMTEVTLEPPVMFYSDVSCWRTRD